MIYAKLVEAAFNLVMLGGVIIASLSLYRIRNLAQLGLCVIGLFFTAALVAASLCAGDAFFAMRLISYTLFIYLPLQLLVATFMFARSVRWVAALCALGLGILLAVGVDAFLIEPNWLEETQVVITTSKLPKKLRIAVIADLQTDQFRDYERSVLEKCMGYKPDLILLAGDYVQVQSADDWNKVRGSINEHLKSIEFGAPLGIYAVQGNTDHPLWEQIFDGVEVRRMTSTESLLVNDSLRLTGLGIFDSFDRRMVIPAYPQFHVALGHAPDYALGKIEADLMIAGHTHGGQVRLPLIGPLMTASAIPRSWAAGVTKFDDGRTLVVSRGIGMERRNAPRLRFLCRPQLVVIDVMPAVEN